jgi:CheY-like chemotaxis protein
MVGMMEAGHEWERIGLDSEELELWLAPFLERIGNKTRRRMCPRYVAGLIGPGDRKSVQPMAVRFASGDYDQLHQSRHKYLLVGDGRNALQAATVFGPEAILLDIGLPGMDGYSVAARFARINSSRA